MGSESNSRTHPLVTLFVFFIVTFNRSLGTCASGGNHNPRRRYSRACSHSDRGLLGSHRISGTVVLGDSSSWCHLSGACSRWREISGTSKFFFLGPVFEWYFYLPKIVKRIKRPLPPKILGRLGGRKEFSVVWLFIIPDLLGLYVALCLSSRGFRLSPFPRVVRCSGYDPCSPLEPCVKTVIIKIEIFDATKWLFCDADCIALTGLFEPCHHEFSTFSLGGISACTWCADLQTLSFH